MRLYVLSDTHGVIDKALAIYEKLQGVDMIVHLGDMVNDAFKISKITGKETISIKGNNDFFNSKEDFQILSTEYGNLLLTHGHRQNVKYNLNNLLYKAEELNCKAAFFGHTHMPLYAESKGIYLLNPGSLTFPMDGSNGSYAVVNISKEHFSASVVFYN